MLLYGSWNFQQDMKFSFVPRFGLCVVEFSFERLTTFAATDVRNFATRVDVIVIVENIAEFANRRGGGK